MLAWATTEAPGFSVRVHGERLSMIATNEPLTAILKQIAYAGVTVRIDPKVEALVSGQFENEDIQQALDTLLEPFGYVLIWNVIDGPLGRLPKLEEIQVYFPGKKEKIQPLVAVESNLVVDTGPYQNSPQFVRDEILIAFKPGTRVEEAELLLNQIGGTLIDSVPELGIYHVRLPPGSNVPAIVDQLKYNLIVAEAEPNYVVTIPNPPGFAPAARPTGTITAPPAGRGMGPVAILDSGLMPQIGLEDLVAGKLDALDPDRPLNDSLGHGTQMALIAAGAVAPSGIDAGEMSAGVPLLAIRAFDDNGNASNFSLMRSIEYAIENGARVINMSWGSETSSDFLATAIRYAQSKGAVVVAAAGNAPTQKPMYPAAYDNVVAVSAANEDGSLWESSNYGNFITLAAPGKAAFPVGYQGPAGPYAGTSIASAYVARTLALYLDTHPGASAEDAVKNLTRTVTDAGKKGKDTKYGYGLLDAAATARFLKP